MGVLLHASLRIYQKLTFDMLIKIYNCTEFYKTSNNVDIIFLDDISKGVLLFKAENSH